MPDKETVSFTKICCRNKSKLKDRKKWITRAIISSSSTNKQLYMEDGAENGLLISEYKTYLTLLDGQSNYEQEQVEKQFQTIMENKLKLGKTAK